MRFIDLYYHIKPAIPREIQISFRRLLAAHKRKAAKNIWPIDSIAAKKPDGWKGWPENKGFALILQHDVDTEEGLRKCARLADIERQLNFRSSFNFVPEDYFTPPDIRRNLSDTGFEIGVHGLRHDGKTFKDFATFYKRAPQIDYYLNEWEAVGFTSPSMLRNLSLMAELEIEHGCSTFDTDPFEPQSGGMRTIFPFYAENTSGTRNYIELPYTLPQDHCLFVILKENDIRIWKEKLDWIAGIGGMALLNSHPDYMNFDGSEYAREEYPVAFYIDFLEYAQTKHAGQYWHALPRELARFWRNSMPIKGSRANQLPKSSIFHFKGRTGKASGAAGHSKIKIWIDLDNTPHVPFFIPIINELKRRGYQVIVTARDAFQVCELAESAGLLFTKIGHHYGKNPFMKIIGLLRRSVQLYSFSRRHRPNIAVSHGARSQILLCNMLRIPTILIADYEYARIIPIARPKWMIVPESISEKDLPIPFYRVRAYPGIKENVYVPNFNPDPSLLDELGLTGDEIVVTVRPPADEAHYHNPQSDILFLELMARISQTPRIRTVLLPRNQHQEQSFKARHPDWFTNSKTVVPNKAVDGLNLLWYSDLVVSGGGTMNREAAALAVPVYSIFRGKTGSVDRMLEMEGRLIMIHTKEEVWTNICFQRRIRNLLPASPPRPTFEKILYNIENIIEIQQASTPRWPRYAKIPPPTRGQGRKKIL